jgi:ribA/ribD-fused uncharacterized protein
MKHIAHYTLQDQYVREKSAFRIEGDDTVVEKDIQAGKEVSSKKVRSIRLKRVEPKKTTEEGVLSTITESISALTESILPETSAIETIEKKPKERKTKTKEKSMTPTIAITQESQVKRPVILFDDITGDEGYMRLEYVAPITIDGIDYLTADRALYAELAKAFNDEEMIEYYTLIASDPDNDPEKYTYEEVILKKPEITKAEWDQKFREILKLVIRKKFELHPTLKDKLFTTGDAKIGFAAIDDTELSIGKYKDDPESQDSTKWSETGQNLLGQIIEEVRDELRLEQERTAKGELEKAAAKKKRVISLRKTAAQPVATAADQLPTPPS